MFIKCLQVINNYGSQKNGHVTSFLKLILSWHTCNRNIKKKTSLKLVKSYSIPLRKQLRSSLTTFCFQNEQHYSKKIQNYYPFNKTNANT